MEMLRSRWLGRVSYAEALALCLRGRSRFPDDAELLLLEGTLRAETGDLLGAQFALVRLLGMAGGGTYRAYCQLAVVCHGLGQHREAERLFRRAVVANPDWLPAWRGLAELYREQGREEDLAEIERLGG